MASRERERLEMDVPKIRSLTLPARQNNLVFPIVIRDL